MRVHRLILDDFRCFKRNSLLRDVFGVPDRPDDILVSVRKIEACLAAGRSALEAELGPNDPVASGLRWELHDVEINGPMDEDDVADL